MSIRITNIAHPPQYVTLPAPYQGIMRSGAVEVIDTTEAEFLAKMGGSNVSLGVLNIETVGDAATIEVDRSVTDVDLVTLIIGSATATGYASTQRIEVTTLGTGNAVTVDLIKGVGGDDIDEDVIYTIKDMGGNAEAENITVSCSSTFVDTGTSTYVIETDYASIGVYKSAGTGRFVVLPGVSSGGGGAETISDPAAMASGPSNFVGTTTVLCDTSAAAVTVVLELPGGVLPLDEGVQYTIKDATSNASVNNITIEAHTPWDIEGSPTYVMTANGQSVTLVRDSNGETYII